MLTSICDDIVWRNNFGQGCASGVPNLPSSATCLNILRCIEFYGNTYKNVQRISRILCFIQKSFNVYRLLINFPDGLRLNIWKKLKLIHN